MDLSALQKFDTGQPDTPKGQINFTALGGGIVDKRSPFADIRMGGTTFDREKFIREKVDIGTRTERLLGAPKALIDTFLPATTQAIARPLNIIGEGLAYALDDVQIKNPLSRFVGGEFLVQKGNVREQYKAGNLDILPNVTKTRPKDLALGVLMAGIELATYKTFAKQMGGRMTARLGIGAFQGLGFAVSEGVTKGYTAEQIAKNALTYGAFGAGGGAITPYLVPMLRTNLEKLPTASRTAIKGIFNEARGGRLSAQMTRMARISNKATHLEAPKKLIVKATKTQAENVAITKIERQIQTTSRQADAPTGGIPRVAGNVDQIDAAVTGTGREVFQSIEYAPAIQRAQKMVVDDPQQVMKMIYGTAPIPADMNVNILRSVAIDAFEKAGQKSRVAALKSLHKTSSQIAAQDLGAFRLDKGLAGTMQTESWLTNTRLAKMGRKLVRDSQSTADGLKGLIRGTGDDVALRAGKAQLKAQTKLAGKAVLKTRYAKTASQLLDELTC